MDYLIKLALALTLFTFVWLTQEQNQEWAVERNLLKSANNFAAHDAVQQVNRTSLAEGQLLIEDEAAYAAFLQSLSDNLGLNESLEPLPGSRLRQAVQVVWFEIIDEQSVTFPYYYENPEYSLVKTLRGPAVIAIIETPHPVLVNTGMSQPPIRVPAIQEYASFY